MPNHPYRDDDGYSCFPGNGNSIVTVNGGVKYVEDVMIGDLARVVLDDGSFDYSEVWCLAHKNSETEATFTQIDLESRRLTLSPKHYLCVMENGKKVDIMAKDIKVGDKLYVMKGDVLINEEVTAVESCEGKGVYAPFTESGRLLVNDVLVSCYAEFPPDIAHKALEVYRTYTPSVVYDTLMEPNENGLPRVFDAAYRLLSPFAAE